MAPLLQVERSTKRFGGLIANRDVSLAIEPGEIVGLIGPNGAGKTTLFNCISGALHPDEGRIVLDGADITHARPERVCRLGIARTWQVVRSFGRMTVLENVVCGAFRRTSRVAAARGADPASGARAGRDVGTALGSGRVLRRLAETGIALSAGSSRD